MSHSNPFRDSVSTTSNPFVYTLSWHSRDHVWYGRREDGASVRVDKMQFCIVEPSLFTITGKQGEARYWSNLCRSFSKYDVIHIRETEGRHTIDVAKGRWKDIKPTLRKGPAWTKVVGIMLLYARISVKLPNGEYGQAESIQPGCLAQLRMRGGAIASQGVAAGWGGFCDSVQKEYGVSEDDMAAFICTYKSAEKVIGNTFDAAAVNYYPVFAGRPINVGEPGEKALLEKMRPLFNKIEDYLSIEHGTTSSSSQPETEDYTYDPELDQSNTSDEASDAVTDDDLPF